MAVNEMPRPAKNMNHARDPTAPNRSVRIPSLPADRGGVEQGTTEDTRSVNEGPAAARLGAGASETKLSRRRMEGCDPRSGVPDREDEAARDRLYLLASGFRMTQALYVAAKLGIADRLVRGPQDAQSLAGELNVHPDSLFRVLRALAAVGVFTVDPQGRFALSPVGEYLRSDVQDSLAAFATFQGEEPYAAFGDLLHTVRTGETAFDHRYGMGHFDYLARHPEAGVTFHRTMAAGHASDGDPLEGCDLGDRRVLVDIGGGRGALLAAVLLHRPTLRGVLFDVPVALVDAPAFLEAAHVTDRCEIRTGSAFDAVPSGGDVYVLSRILHDWPDDRALQLLRNCRAAMPPGGLLILLEGVLPETAPPPTRVQLDLMMMVMNGGRERTEAEWRRLLGRAGFALDRVLPGRRNQDRILASPSGVVPGEAPGPEHRSPPEDR